MSKWTAICTIGVVTAICGAIVASDFSTTGNNTTTVTCPAGTTGQAGQMGGYVVVVCNPK